MANSKEQKKPSYRLKVMEKATLAPEARNEAVKEQKEAIGHFRKFFGVFRGNLQQLTITNLLTLIFALPLIAVVFVFMFFGAEQITYFVQDMEIPYLLSGFGIGLSAGVSLMSVKIKMLLSYRLLICAIAVCLPILGIGLAGNLYVATKQVWDESFITKKDKYGNDVPRIVLEYFRGIKQFWKEPVIVMAITGAVFAGIGNVIISGIEGIWSAGSPAGYYVLIVFASLFALAYMMVFVNWLPLTITYKMNVFTKFKNACLITVCFPIPSVIMIILAFGPFCILFAGGILAILIGVLVLSVGLSYLTMVLVHYGAYNSEQLLVPLYEASVGGGNLKGKENRKEKRAKAQNKTYNNSYKKKK